MVWKCLAKDFSSPFIHAINYQDAASSPRTTETLEGVKVSIAVDYRERKWRWCPEQDAFKEQGRIILRKLGNKGFFSFLDEGQRESAKALRELVVGYSGTDWREKTGKELSGAYARLYSAWLELNFYGHMINASDIGNEWLSSKVSAFLNERSSGKKVSAAEAVASLLAPNEPSQVALADESFFSILAAKQEGGDWEALLRKHVQEFDWLEFHYDGPRVLDENYFRGLLESEEKQGVSGRQRLDEIRGKSVSLEERQGEVTKTLGLSEEEIYWTKVAKTFMFLKDLRKSAVFFASRHSDSMLNEIARRLGLTPVQTRHLSPLEAAGFLNNGTRVSLSEIDERIRYCLVVSENGFHKIYSGVKALELSKQIVEEKAEEDIEELKGTPAFHGLVKGTAKLVLEASDMLKLKEGDVLVSHATNPNLVPAMKRASAIVTDEGGVTCHAAIVSRELRIPCVIGTKFATQWLKDGDFVEVDANRGIVKRVVKKIA